MREILFRAWDKKKKEFIKNFAVINGLCFVETNSDDNRYVDVYQNDGMKETYYSAWATYQKIDATLMQNTGLTDRNDKPIFEGDIVNWKYFRSMGGLPYDMTMIVEWDEVNPCFRLRDIKNKNFIEYDFVKCNLTEIKIIGDIHTTPELLTS